jgi:ppGpp synthetase/RelA/SpoT-type nucleotidyltranferase
MSKPAVNPVNQLGRRLRQSNSPSQEDLEQLGEIVEMSGFTLDIVERQLRLLGLDLTTRLKNTFTIIEKLKREPSLQLSKIHDLAGARIHRDMTLDEQDEIVSRITQIWPDARVKDRRIFPTHGYRAVHVIVGLDGRFVEVQVRTHYQHIWAQATESLGDLWGRGIRYGGAPEEPDRRVSDQHSLTRRELIEAWKDKSNDFHGLAVLENKVSRIRTRIPMIQDVEERSAEEHTVEELVGEITVSFNSDRRILEALSRVLR